MGIRTGSSYVRALAFVFLLLSGAVSGFAQQPFQTGTPATTHIFDGLLDINTATLDQLKILPGMGEAYARRVIAGRPYTAKNQLVTRGILPQEAYNAMQRMIIAKHPKQ